MQAGHGYQAVLVLVLEQPAHLAMVLRGVACVGRTHITLDAGVRFLTVAVLPALTDAAPCRMRAEGRLNSAGRLETPDPSGEKSMSTESLHTSMLSMDPPSHEDVLPMLPCCCIMRCE